MVWHLAYFKGKFNLFYLVLQQPNQENGSFFEENKLKTYEEPQQKQVFSKKCFEKKYHKFKNQKKFVNICVFSTQCLFFSINAIRQPLHRAKASKYY